MGVAIAIDPFQVVNIQIDFDFHFLPENLRMSSEKWPFQKENGLPTTIS